MRVAEIWEEQLTFYIKYNTIAPVTDNSILVKILRRKEK